MKGSALNLGFERFASMCQNGEALAKTNKVDAPMVAEIIECYSESRKLFLDGAKNPVQKAG